MTQNSLFILGPVRFWSATRKRIHSMFNITLLSLFQWPCFITNRPTVRSRGFLAMNIDKAPIVNCEKCNTDSHAWGNNLYPRGIPFWVSHHQQKGVMDLVSRWTGKACRRQERQRVGSAGSGCLGSLNPLQRSEATHNSPNCKHCTRRIGTVKTGTFLFQKTNTAAVAQSSRSLPPRCANQTRLGLHREIKKALSHPAF